MERPSLCPTPTIATMPLEEEGHDTDLIMLSKLSPNGTSLYSGGGGGMDRLIDG